ncbi:MAG: LysR family transcriptional regulator [Pseudomonadota bacterium]
MTANKSKDNYKVSQDPNAIAFEVKNLLAFLAVVEHRSFKKASQALDLTPAALHKRIEGLRNSLGLSSDDALFDRHGHAGKIMEPTYLGKVLFEQGMMLRRHINETLQDVKNAKEKRPPVRVGIQNSIHRILAREISRYFSSDLSDAEIATPRISFRAERPEILLEDLESGLLDIVTTMTPMNMMDALDNTFECTTLYQEKLVLVSSDPDCRTLQDVLALPEGKQNGARGSRFVMVDWGAEFNFYLRKLFSEHGGVQIDYSFNRTTGALTLIADPEQPHYCAGFFPMARIAEYLDGNKSRNGFFPPLHLVDGHGHLFSHNVSLIHRRSEDSALESVWSSDEIDLDEGRYPSAKRDLHYADIKSVVAAIKNGRNKLWREFSAQLPKETVEVLKLADTAPKG